MIWKPRIRPASGSTLNKNCDGTSADMGVGVRVGVGVGVSVGLIVGVGDEGGLLVTTLRGEMVPHAAMKASSKRIKPQTDHPLRTEAERNFITKMMRSRSGLLATLAARRAERMGLLTSPG